MLQVWKSYLSLFFIIHPVIAFTYMQKCTLDVVNCIAHYCAETNALSHCHQTILQPVVIIGTSISGWHVNCSGYARLISSGLNLLASLFFLLSKFFCSGSHFYFLFHFHRTPYMPSSSQKWKWDCAIVFLNISCT